MAMKKSLTWIELNHIYAVPQVSLLCILRTLSTQHSFPTTIDFQIQILTSDKSASVRRG
jgi:hypothetical protein